VEPDEKADFGTGRKDQRIGAIDLIGTEDVQRQGNGNQRERNGRNAKRKKTRGLIWGSRFSTTELNLALAT